MRHIQRSILLLICLTVLFASFVGAQEKQSSDLFPISVKRKAGFIDRTGKVIIEPQFEAVNDFSDGLARIYVSGNKFDTAYINELGKIVIEPQFDIGSNFSEGFVWVGFDPHKTEYKFGNKTYYSGTASDSFDYNIGFIDKTGKFITEPIFTFAEDFSEGLAVVRTKENKFGFIDKSGKIALEPIYDVSSEFYEGLNPIYLNGGKYGFIDRTGKTVLKTEFGKVDDFKNGLAEVCESYEINARCGYIDKTGKVIWQPTK